MTRSRRPSAQTISVLLALANQPTTWRYGYDLCQELGLKAGSMYPILMRLADRGLLETTWETDPPRGRPGTCTGSPAPASTSPPSWPPSRSASPPRRRPATPASRGSGCVRRVCDGPAP